MNRSAFKIIPPFIALPFAWYLQGLEFMLFMAPVVICGTIFGITSEPGMFKKYFWVNTVTAALMVVTAACGLVWAITRVH
ncbi:MAG TPA: hypothetical protein PLL77_04055 [Pyrinomonadaceae bacterium]|nr:hypothetical protein [Pyrinomonadaceae bacterium]